MMLSEAIQWIALGWAMRDKDFRQQVDRRAGPNAFTGAARILYDAIFEWQDEKQWRELLGFEPEGNLVELMLEHLTAEAEALWNFRNDKANWGTARALKRIMDECTAMLMALARHTGEKPVFSEVPGEFEGGDGI